MKKSARIFKKYIASFLVVLMSIESFGAIVSDNDGSAFVTKAEFETLKANFVNQIQNYNDSIDRKIDGAIAHYLAGIKTSNTATIKTGFNVQGIENKMYFLGKSAIPDYGNSPPKAINEVFCVLTTGYSRNDWWQEDTQHSFAWRAVWEYGSPMNNLIERDGNYLIRILKNAKAHSEIYAAGYGASNYYFWYGGTWGNLTATIPEPTEELIKNGLPSSTTWPFNRQFFSYGLYHQLDHTTPGTSEKWGIYKNEHHDDYGTRSEGHSDGTSGNCVYISPELDCTSAVNCADANYSLDWTYDAEARVNYHWPWGQNNTTCVKPIIRQADGTQTLKSNYNFLSDQTYTNTIIINSLTGNANADWESFSSGVWSAHPVVLNDTTGSVAMLNYQLENVTNYFYKEIKDYFDKNEKVGSGFYVCSCPTGSSGYLELELMSNAANTGLYFSKDEFSGTIDTTKYLSCQLYNETSGSWEETIAPVLISRNKSYKVRVNFAEDAKDIFLAVTGPGNNINSFWLELTQTKDATITTS